MTQQPIQRFSLPSGLDAVMPQFPTAVCREDSEARLPTAAAHNEAAPRYRSHTGCPVITPLLSQHFVKSSAQSFIEDLAECWVRRFPSCARRSGLTVLMPRRQPAEASHNQAQHTAISRLNSAHLHFFLLEPLDKIGHIRHAGETGFADLVR